jgi:hypothetical protein
MKGKKIMKRIIAVLLLVALLAGCGSTAKNVNMEELYAALESVGMPEMVSLKADMMLDFYGIKAEDVKQAVVTVCSDGLRADEVWLLEAVSADAAAKLKGLAENRLKQKDAESVTYSPEQNAIVKKAFLTVEGNYVILIVSPDVEQRPTDAAPAASAISVGKYVQYAPMTGMPASLTFFTPTNAFLLASANSSNTAGSSLMSSIKYPFLF